MAQRKHGDKNPEKIPSLSLRGQAATSSPRKPLPSSRTAKSQRVLGQIKELNTKRPVLLKPISDDQKIQTVCDWMANVPPGKFGSWLYRFTILLESLSGLRNVAPEIRTLASAALSQVCAVITVQKVANKYPHWGPFCAAPESAEHPALARVMIMESARVKSDVEEDDLETLWVIVISSNLDVITVDPLDRVGLLLDDVQRYQSSADWALLQAGMKLDFVSVLEHELRKYSVKKYPCPNSAINVVVRYGQQYIGGKQRNCIRIDIGVGSEHDAYQWSAKWTSEWRIVIDSDDRTTAEITAEISSDVYSLSFGAFRMRQRRKIPTYCTLINLDDISGLAVLLAEELEYHSDETQMELQRWLCAWHETSWGHICRDNTYAAVQFGPLVMLRRSFQDDLRTAIKETLGS